MKLENDNFPVFLFKELLYDDTGNIFYMNDTVCNCMADTILNFIGRLTGLGIIYF